MKPRLEGTLPAAILKNVSVGIALFGADDFSLEWCNQSFKKQTWFGGAAGGKNAKEVSFFDLFDKKDHRAVMELFNIACSLGSAYDFQRVVRRGPVGAFPAELRLHRHATSEYPQRTLVCIEIRDLSLSKQYDELEAAHTSMRERLSDLMAAEAELHYSVRMSTISEIGADMAHSLINPVTMCRDIVEREIIPQLSSQEMLSEAHKVLSYLQNIEELAVWFRKFSNPRLSEIQMTNVSSLIDDALLLNTSRFSKLGITPQVIRKKSYNPFVLAVPVHLIMWLNAAFSEISSVLPHGNGGFFILLDGDEDNVKLRLEGNLTPGSQERLLPHTLEKFAKRLPAGAHFEWTTTEEQVSFCLQLACFSEPEKDNSPHKTLKEPDRSKHLKNQCTEGPCILIVDDEKDIRRLLKRTFMNLGVDCLEASDGLQALELLTANEHAEQASKVRAVVSDVRMPNMTGIHFFQELRKQKKLHVPFIFFSSNIVDPKELKPERNANEAFTITPFEQVHFLTKDSDLDRLKSLVITLMAHKK